MAPHPSMLFAHSWDCSVGVCSLSLSLEWVSRKAAEVWNQGVLPLDRLPSLVVEPHLPGLELIAALPHFDDPVIGHMRSFCRCSGAIPLPPLALVGIIASFVRGCLFTSILAIHS